LSTHILLSLSLLINLLNPKRGKCRSRHNSLLRPSPPRRIPFLESNLTVPLVVIAIVVVDKT